MSEDKTIQRIPPSRTWVAAKNLPYPESALTVIYGEDREEWLSNDISEAALSTLTPRDRDMFRMRYQEKKTLDDIARAYSVSKGTVGHLLNEACWCIRRFQKAGMTENIFEGLGLSRSTVRKLILHGITTREEMMKFIDDPLPDSSWPAGARRLQRALRRTYPRKAEDRTLIHLVGKGIVTLDTNWERFDLAEIDCRRFLYNPRTGTLVFGKETEYSLNAPENHAEEFYQARVPGGERFDEFARGWILGGGPECCIDFHGLIGPMTEERFNRNFSTLEMFRANGAGAEAIVKNFGTKLLEKMRDYLPDAENT